MLACRAAVSGFPGRGADDLDDIEATVAFLRHRQRFRLGEVMWESYAAVIRDLARCLEGERQLSRQHAKRGCYEGAF